MPTMSHHPTTRYNDVTKRRFPTQHAMPKFSKTYNTHNKHLRPTKANSHPLHEPPTSPRVIPQSSETIHTHAMSNLSYSDESICSACCEKETPCPHHSSQHPKQRYINPVARVLLAAVLLPSPNSPFSILSACPDLVQTIYQYLKLAWAHSLTPGYDDVHITRFGGRTHLLQHPPDQLLSKVALCRVVIRDLNLPRPAGLGFPKPAGLMCNMLPFLAGDLDTIPPEYRGYLPLIKACRGRVTDPGRVWYLTIHESEALSYGPQRRGGIHVEGFLARPATSTKVPFWHHWGFTLGPTAFSGGIFHMSSVARSCKMWNVQIPRQPSAALGIGCDLEHMRGVLDDTVTAVYPEANELYWMTDATPHESLPLEKGTYRQYFRLVTSQISAWWEKHSTKNRLGVQPDCRILRHSKFDSNGYVGFEECGDPDMVVSGLESSNVEP